MERKIIAIDIFCGAGGFSWAAKQLGVKVLAAIENNRQACDTYRRNFINNESEENQPILYQEDALILSPDAIMKDIEIQAGSLDIFMGGPPCQGFSSHRLSNDCVNDPRNQLLNRYFDFVRAIMPKTFIVENVSGLLWNRHKQHLDKFYNLAKESGYNIFAPEVLDAKDFGVPQSRKRVFILGVRNDLDLQIAWPPKPTHFNPNSKEVRELGKPAWSPSSDVFDIPIKDDDSNNLHMNHCAELIEVFESTPQNGGSRSQSNRQLPCHKKHKGHKDVYGRIDPSKPAPTMTGGCTNPSKGRFLHPTKNHGITLREAARFQTFPEEFVFSGGLTAASTQIGNAVPIELGKRVLKTIIESIGE